MALNDQLLERALRQLQWVQKKAGCYRCYMGLSVLLFMGQ